MISFLSSGKRSSASGTFELRKHGGHMGGIKESAMKAIRQALSIRLPVKLTSVLAALLLWTRPGAEEPEARASALIGELRSLVAAQQANLMAQAAAWPTREEDQREEKPTPPAVRTLENSYRALEEKTRQVQARLVEEAEKDVSPVLSALGQANNDVAFIDILVQVAARAGKDDTSTTTALIQLAERFEPCPPRVVSALADVDCRDADMFLLELGAKEKSPAILAAAGRAGDPAVVQSLISWAEDEDKALSKASLRAVSRLEPPSKVHPRRFKELQESSTDSVRGRGRGLELMAGLDGQTLYLQELRRLTRSKIETVRSENLRTALIVYLGLFREREDLPFLKGVLEKSQDETVRLAILGALGNLGEEAGEFLLEQLRERGSDLAAQKRCVEALGASRHRLAARALMDLLDDPALQEEALRALRRIAGQDFGRSPNRWLRWWRAQPEVSSADKDPDSPRESG
jgi:hypothetical protein